MCVPFGIKNFSGLSARQAVLVRTEQAFVKILGIKVNAHEPDNPKNASAEFPNG